MSQTSDAQRHRGKRGHPLLVGGLLRSRNLPQTIVETWAPTGQLGLAGHFLGAFNLALDPPLSENVRRVSRDPKVCLGDRGKPKANRETSYPFKWGVQAHPAHILEGSTPPPHSLGELPHFKTHKYTRHTHIHAYLLARANSFEIRPKLNSACSEGYPLHRDQQLIKHWFMTTVDLP